MNSDTIRILVGDSRELFRKGLRAIFDPEPDIEVVAEATDGPEVVRMAGELHPGVVLLDIMIPKLDGVAVCRRIHGSLPGIEVLLLSDAQTDDRIREAFGAGARAFLSKSCETSELVYAVRKAARGDYYLCGPAGDEMVAEYVRPLLDKQRPGGLMTPRERELARLLADGYSSKEAAAVLNISPKTAEAHRASIMKKLNARNVTDIVKYCIRNHLIEP